MYESEQLLPKVPLDRLMTEVQARLQAVVAARDGVHSLLEAVVSIGRELDLESVLRRIVEVATDLVDCRYGALGVIGDDGQLAQFIPVGLSEDEIAHIAHWPHGRGLLGLLIKEPRSLRLDEISGHPESYGFPEGHPPMHSFLGVPIRVRDAVFGNLYLTEKNGGRDFDEQDETIVTALATAAGIAIENARLYDASRRRETWLDASAEVTQALLSGSSVDDALRLIASHARTMSSSHTAAVIAPDDDAAGLMRVLTADGDGADALNGLRFSAEGTLSEAVLRSGEPRVVAEIRRGVEPAPLLDRLPAGPAVLVPLGAEPQVRGVLVLARQRGEHPFAGPAVRMLQAFASQAAVGLELADARKDAERHGLVDDRERIARDLHDVVVQRLFASAMSLTAAARLIDRPDVAARVERTVDDLDATIRQIRSTIFALQSSKDDVTDTLRGRLVAVVQSAGEQLGFAPGLQLIGELDNAVSDEIAEQLVPVLQESLSNIVRHAKASRAGAVVELSGGRVRVTVTDNGVGLPEVPHRSGLANLAERAARLGGTFTAGPAPDGGTVVCWDVPAGGAQPSASA
ncbi:GAF domain-containing sensor histidine kinase [Jiangella sp. DSM 45060]|uniref:sensor histidine kinase n=1 Tax=Jiangella sp. DSM 45060 TaxID=1798224 RepID=UPI00087A95C5|nr:GAF domain-containing protein [Jiangella sp. DSM 45060]SDT06785.1 Histidine kinase-, DNA gyrase B-, and HSP90-like ATPase [Jiangella sp. DSM 45060]